MRSDLIRVKKPAWVRIVNPEPIDILDMTWRYGSYVQLEPGGVFHIISGDGCRTLAMYQPPCAPSDQCDAPPDALVLHTLDDLRLLAEGQISFDEPFEHIVPDAIRDALAVQVRLGDCARVPRSRMVRRRLPHVVRERRVGGPYREGIEVKLSSRLTEYRAIRPGGTMTVFTFGDAPRTLLKVRYRANPDYRGKQCESGAWFYIPEEEFLRMEKDARRLAELEALERAAVLDLLRSL